RRRPPGAARRRAPALAPSRREPAGNRRHSLAPERLMRARTRQSGFTLLEMALGGAITAFVLTGVAGLLFSTNGLAQRSHANPPASATTRRSLERLADLMRGAAVTSLTGFNVAGVATTPVFQIVTGLNAGNPVLSLPYTLQWQAVVAS